MNETISFMAGFAFHRVEGYQSYPIITPQIFPDYSIDNPAKPNIKTYDFSIGMRANFSQKPITPYFVLKTGFLFIDVPRYSDNYYYHLPSENGHKIDYYVSPGFGVNFD